MSPKGNAERSGVDLRLPGGPVVARYELGDDVEGPLVPRPYLHPVRTLAGSVVTAVRPPDHPWHLGASLAVPDVDGANLWGGPTFVAGSGYVDRHDHGRIRHLAWVELEPSGFVEQLDWEDGTGAALLHEQREIRVEPVAREPLSARAWRLQLRFTLRSARTDAVALRSPQTNGRAGAAYGGFFWRAAFPAGRRIATSAGDDEAAANGRRARWVALSGFTDGPGTACTVAFAGSGAADPWFVRAAEYPGVGAALATDTPLRVGPAGIVRAIEVVVADGFLTPEEIDLVLPRDR